MQAAILAFFRFSCSPFGEDLVAERAGVEPALLYSGG